MYDYAGKFPGGDHGQWVIGTITPLWELVLPLEKF